jgi:hypothetical protein
MTKNEKLAVKATINWQQAYATPMTSKPSWNAGSMGHCSPVCVMKIAT